MRNQILLGEDTDAWNLGYQRGLERDWRPNPDVPKEHLRAYQQGYCRGALQAAKDRRSGRELHAEDAGDPEVRGGGAAQGPADTSAA